MVAPVPLSPDIISLQWSTGVHLKVHSWPSALSPFTPFLFWNLWYLLGFRGVAGSPGGHYGYFSAPGGCIKNPSKPNSVHCTYWLLAVDHTQSLASGQFEVWNLQINALMDTGHSSNWEGWGKACPALSWPGYTDFWTLKKMFQRVKSQTSFQNLFSWFIPSLTRNSACFFPNTGPNSRNTKGVGEGRGI